MNKNLIPMNERTKEEQREIARKGGRESGKVRRRKRTMKDAAHLILRCLSVQNRWRFCRNTALQKVTAQTLC